MTRCCLHVSPVLALGCVACRSRRASQQLSRSAESIDQSYKRSKSRSVDHGFAAPFDLDSLRSKVEGRFDAVHKDEDEQSKRLPPPTPIKTMTYTVRDRDTLTSLAARFDTTPSELTKLNRLATQFIFPGQTLLVPDKRKEILDNLRPVSPDAPASSSAPQRFLKINVRHITDGQGVVSGVLLVTPNAVMFDPNVSDTLVMEHGPESYGVIAPMEYVVNAAIFYDIAHMRTHGPDHNAHNDADIVLSADWVPPVCLPRTEPPLSAPPLGENDRAVRKPAAVSFSLDGNQKEDPGKPDKKNKMLKRLSYPLSWVEGLTGEGPPTSQADSLPTSADSHNSTSVFSKVFNRRSSLGGFGRSHPKATGPTQPRLDYRSMVSVDDMPDLFASFDKLIPRPARPSDDPPLYLRLRMGKPAGRPLPRSTPLMSYGRKRMKPEYWFGIPRNRVDDLFKFLTHWVPERYGPLRDVTAHGYELIDSDTEWDDDDSKPGQKERSGSAGDVSDITRESWELLKAPYVKVYSIMKSQAEALGDSLGEEPQPEVLT
ncbi:jg23796 [Pararge aegeria aegeria]|uniref:Jg23796 protein n=1 Tax=Pararge aegeria aegeria TaxID=348720 RepID=A0A8S4SME4_9NEOP|nr:jg23796 [Pararge aegeria aegeria]